MSPRFRADDILCPVFRNFEELQGVVMTFPNNSGPESGVWKRARNLEGWARALFEGIDDAVFVHDLRGRILDANPAACRRLGYTREELLKMNTRDIDDPEFAKGFNQRLEKQMLEGGGRFEGRHRTKEGKLLLVDINSSSIEFDGRPCVLAVMRDVTRQKAVELAQRKQTQLLRSVLENMSDGVLVVGSGQTLLVSNPIAQQLFGLDRNPTPEQWPLGKGLYLSDQITPFPPSEFPWIKVLQNQDIVNAEMYVFPPNDESGRWVSLTTRPLKEGESIRGSITVCRDVTTQKRSERRLSIQSAISRVFIGEDVPGKLEEFIVRTLGAKLAWDVAILWMVDTNAKLLRFSAIWHRSGLDLKAFEELARKGTFERKQALPGRVWDQALPSWVLNISDDPDLKHIPVLADLGIKRAFAFPIWVSGTVTGVLESFSRRQEVPSRDTMTFAVTLGNQVGQMLERRRVELALRESQAFYHSLVETLPQNLFRKDRSGKLTFANRRYCDLLGYSLEELIGKTDFDLFPEELAAKYVADDQKVLASGEPFTQVEAHQLADGTPIYVEVIKTPIHDADGNIIGTQGLFWDVTAKKRAEERLAASEQRYRQLTEATLDAIVVADLLGNIILINPAAVNLFGYSSEEVEGRPLIELFSRVETETQPIDISELSGKTRELFGIRMDGTIFPVELALTAIDPIMDDEHPEPTNIGYLGAVRDLTERNRMRSVLVQNEKLASIGLLSAGVAHEINNPLAFIGNNLAVLERDLGGVMEILKDYQGLDDKLATVDAEAMQRIHDLAEEIDLEYIEENLSRLLTRTRDGVDRVAKIVQSLRGLARSGKPQYQQASLADLLDASVEILHNRLKRSNIRLERETDGDTNVLCVAPQISQVFLNFLMNAIQAVESKPNGEEGLIRIRMKRGNGEMCITFTDYGCGIAPEDLPQLYDPFFTTKEIGEGTGLGLSISHNIIDGHGGRVEVESTLGQGTTFHIFLPLKQS